MTASIRFQRKIRMSSRKLFIQRLLKGWRYQYDVLKTIADWTVMLYIIIPAITIFLFVYRSWWIEIPNWIENVPFFLLFFLLYLTSWNGNIRTYVETADKVLLIKKSYLFLGMKNWGYGYSLVFHAFTTIEAIFILLPFLFNHYLFEWEQIGSLLFYLISLKTVLMLVIYHLVKIETRLKKFVWIIISFLIVSTMGLLIYSLWKKGFWFPIYLSGVIVITLSIYLSLRSIKKLSFIDHQINMEQKHRNGNIELIFTMAPEIEKPVVTKRTKPLFFRRSKRIFKKRTQSKGFTELFIKVFLRNYSYISGYILMVNVTTIAIVLLPPIWIKVFIFTGYLIMMYSLISLIWDKIMRSNPIMKKYLEQPSYFRARRKVIWVLYLISILLLVFYFLFGVSVTSRLGMMTQI